MSTPDEHQTPPQSQRQTPPQSSPQSSPHDHRPSRGPDIGRPHGRAAHPSASVLSLSTGLSISRERRQAFAPGAYAVVKSDPPLVFLADNATVISRLVALKVVAREDPASFTGSQLDQVRRHLLRERWAEAVMVWMSATDTHIDVYEEYVPVWTDDDLNADVASMEIRMARLFTEPGER